MAPVNSWLDIGVDVAFTLLDGSLPGKRMHQGFIILGQRFFDDVPLRLARTKFGAVPVRPSTDFVSYLALGAIHFHGNLTRHKKSALNP
jgi:hypothetical protein